MSPAAAPLLVFAHYFGGSARSWHPLIAALGDGRHVAPDLPGFGDTAPLPDATLDAYALAFAALAGTRPWIGVGHSMGGKIALAAALRRAPNLLGLVLIAASPPTPEPMTDEVRRATLDAYGDRRAARQQLRQASHRLTPKLLAQCIDDKLRVAEPTWRWWLESGSRADISAPTRAIDLPVLVIAGDDDEVMGTGVAQGIAANLRQATLRIVPDAGHLVPLERPAAVAALIRGFAEAIATRPPVQ